MLGTLLTRLPEAVSSVVLISNRQIDQHYGDVLRAIGRPLEFTSGDEPVRVQYFLIRATGVVPAAEEREKRWFEIEEARLSLSYESARDILAAAASAITAMTVKP
jgi:hypothetical protein